MFGASRNRTSAKKEQTEQRGGQLLQSSQFTEAAAAFLDAWNMDRTDGQNLLNCGTAIWLEVTEYFKLAGLTAIAGCKCGRPQELFIAFATNPDRVPGGILGDQVRTGAGTKDLEAIRQSLTVAEQCMRLAMTMEKQGNALVWLCHLLRGQARFDECRNEFQNASAAGVLPREVIDEAAPCVERIPDYQSDFEWLTGATGGWTVPDSGKFPSDVARKLGRFTKKLAQQEANVLPDLTPATSASPGSTYVGMWQADEDLRPDGDRDEFLLMCATGLMNALAQRVMPRHPDFQILNKEVTLTREDCGIVFTLSVPSPAHSHILSAEFPIAMQEFVSEMRSAGVTEFLKQFRQYQANSPGGTLPGESAWAPGSAAVSSGSQPPPLPQAHSGAGGQDTRIGFACNHCGHRMRVKPELAGKKIRCNSCRAITHAPDKSETKSKTRTRTKPRSKQSVTEICCQHCSTVQRVPKRLARRKIRCRGCGQSLAGSPETRGPVAGSPAAHNQQPAVPPPLPPAGSAPPSVQLRFDSTPSRNDDCIAALDSRHRGLVIVREALVERMVRSTGFAAEKAAIMTAAPMALMLMRGSMEYEMLLAAAAAMGERATAHELTSASKQVAGVPDSWNGPAWAIQFE